MVSNEPAERIVLTGTAPNGDRIDFVARGKQDCGITRNGRPVPDLQWSPCQPEASTIALMRLLELE